MHLVHVHQDALVENAMCIVAASGDASKCYMCIYALVASKCHMCIYAPVVKKRCTTAASCNASIGGGLLKVC